MNTSIRLAICGLGLIGVRHAEAILKSPGIDLVAAVDPHASGKREAARFGIPCFETIDDLFQREKVDGVVLATPTTLHVEQALECVEWNCPVLIEKPIGTSVEDALALVSRACRLGVPLLVGHHRRYNPLISRAREAIRNGVIGDLRAVQGTCWFYKPDSYFEIAPWRKKTGAGPVSLNLVHDIDLIRYLCGEIVGVQAMMTPSSRGFENEDVAGALLEIDNGVVATISVSDSIVAPWSWELTSSENSHYAPTTENCYLIGGSKGSLSIPDLRLWTHEDGLQDWWRPISATSLMRDSSDPLVNQILHFKDVIRDGAVPIVSGAEGLRNLQVIEAIQLSAKTRERVLLEAGTRQIPEPIRQIA